MDKTTTPLKAVIDAYLAVCRTEGKTPSTAGREAEDHACDDNEQNVGLPHARLVDSRSCSQYPPTAGQRFQFQGLYATGEITGKFFYHNYPGGAGLMRGTVLGRIAGENAAREALGK